ncbi:MAG: hypothetical protein WC538_13990 [Thermoanaerobaculia bacterium]|jgi:hypothetical protein
MQRPNGSSRFLLALVVVVSTLVLAGCFDVEQKIVLKKDLSGKAEFKMGIDFEPMVLIMTAMQREMAGKTGEPTKAELDEARKKFLEEMKKEPLPDLKADIEKANKEMPPGVKMLDATAKQDGLKMNTGFVFSFDDIKKLNQVSMPKDKKEGEEAGGPPAPGSGPNVDKPFEGLNVVDEGKTILITSKPMNPTDEVKKEAPPSEDGKMDKQMEDAFKSMRVAYRIESELEVVEHNAKKKEGNALIWEWKWDDFKKMEKAGTKDFGVRVRYKK